MMEWRCPERMQQQVSLVWFVLPIISFVKGKQELSSNRLKSHRSPSLSVKKFVTESQVDFCLSDIFHKPRYEELFDPCCPMPIAWAAVDSRSDCRLCCSGSS
uniref:Uncharacterized protein n=1 Tax=Entomoneis paludosa TaxID=265537 RepID=A0A7S2YNI1_9STRA